MTSDPHLAEPCRDAKQLRLDRNIASILYAACTGMAIFGVIHDGIGGKVDLLTAVECLFSSVSWRISAIFAGPLP